MFAVAALGVTAPAATPPPQIYRVVTRPMCAELHKHIMPAIAMILENDRTIAKSPPIFKNYMTTAFVSDPRSPSATDKTNYDAPGRTMALQHMEQLVTPLAQNVIAIQKILGSSSLAQPTGVKDDDEKIAQARQTLLAAVAAQSASLDLINGFVVTQQLGDIQHAGEEYLSQIQTPEESSKHLAALATPTPNPAFQDELPGLRQSNPYAIDPAAIPGLQLGYNPVSSIVGGLAWVQGETQKREDAVSDAVKTIAAGCDQPSSPNP